MCGDYFHYIKTRVAKFKDGPSIIDKMEMKTYEHPVKIKQKR